MAKLDVNQIKQLADQTFKNHWPVMVLWQTIADYFYPERADFTVTRNVGVELADNLVDSYPLLIRRDLGNSFSAMLRDGDWFKMGVANAIPDYTGDLWLQSRTRMLRELMYDRKANFVRATKEGDHDYAAFGQCVISVELNKHAEGLLFRCWHLRDVAWFDSETGSVGGVVRKWKPTLREMTRLFKDKVHPEVAEKVKENPFKQGDVRHLVIPTDMYGDDELESRFEWVSIYIDVEHNHIMEEVGMRHMMYVVPRFQTIAGSPYAYSPATVVGLPDARCLQAMTHTLLEAGERYARPPIIATQKVIRSDVNLSPDGVTWVDDEYDERLGTALRTLPQDRGGFPIGLEMRDGIVETLNSAFYLNKINLPEVNREMTAYEVRERMKQFRRENLPLFAPIEAEYNGALCETAFEVAMNAGMMGSPYDIPQSLEGADVAFKFISPLTQSEEEERTHYFSQMSQTLREAAEFDPAVHTNVDFDTAVREAIVGGGAPSSWLADPEMVEDKREALQQQQMAQMAIENGGLDVAQA